MNTAHHSCDVCHRIFQGAAHLRDHMKASHNPCSQCNRTFNKPDALQMHIQASHPPTPSRHHPCSQCGRSFATRDALRDHTQASHPVSVRATSPPSPPKQKGPAFKCGVPECGFAFAHVAELRQHTEKAHKGQAQSAKSTSTINWQAQAPNSSAFNGYTIHSQAIMNPWPSAKPPNHGSQTGSSQPFAVSTNQGGPGSSLSPWTKTPSFKCGVPDCGSTFWDHDSLLNHGATQHGKGKGRSLTISSENSSNTTPSNGRAPIFKCGHPNCGQVFTAHADLKLHSQAHQTLSRQSEPSNSGALTGKSSSYSDLLICDFGAINLGQDNIDLSALKFGKYIVEKIMKHSGGYPPVGANRASSPLTTLSTPVSEMRSQTNNVAQLAMSTHRLQSLVQTLASLGHNGTDINALAQKDQDDVWRLLRIVLLANNTDAHAIRLTEDEMAQFASLLREAIKKPALKDFHSAAHLLHAKLLKRMNPTSFGDLYVEGVILASEVPVGHGGFANVFRGNWGNQAVAIKRINLRDTEDDHRRTFLREVSAWSGLPDHQYILPLLGLDKEAFDSYPIPCIITPWMQNGTLLSWVKANQHGSSTRTIDRLLRESAEGLSFLHDLGIVHSDIRGSNILVSDDIHAKIADFGISVLSNAVHGSQTTNTRSHPGSLLWMAPELHVPQDFGCSRFLPTSSSDIYSFGITLVEVYIGQTPFQEYRPRTDMSIVISVVTSSSRPGRPKKGSPGLKREFSDDAWRIVESCWDQSRDKRPSAKRVLEMMGEIGFGAT